MKYGRLSQGTTSVDTDKSVQIAKGTTSQRPSASAGVVRYNTDTQVVGRGDNDGSGRFETYTTGWNSLVTEKDFEHSKDQKSKQDINDNLLFKMISEQLSDTFVTAAGNITLIQGAANTWIKNIMPSDTNSIPGYFSNVKINNDPNMVNYWDVNPSENSFPEGRTEAAVNKAAGSNTTSAFKAFLGSKKIASVSVSNQGAGYNNPRLILDTNGGSDAILRVLTIGGKVVKNGITIINGGSGYRPGHTKILLKGGGFKTIGVITPVIKNGVITDVNVTSAGLGYLKNPQVIISDGGYGGRLKPVISGGKITRVKVINPGYDYSVTPTIRIVDSVNPSRAASLKANVGAGKIVNVQMLRPVICQFLTNGKYDLDITGGGGSGCTAYLNVQDGAGESVIITNNGSGYTSEPSVSIRDFPGVLTDLAFRRGNTNVLMRFTFDIFKACGVPRSKATRYDLSLLTTINKALPYDAHYAGQAIVMSANLTPAWSPLTNYNHASYGIYNGVIDLYGQRHYYRSGIGASWLANLVKSR